MKALKLIAAEVIEEEVKKSLSVFVEEYIAVQGSRETANIKEVRIKDATEALKRGLYAYRSTLNILDCVIDQFIQGGGEVG